MWHSEDTRYNLCVKLNLITSKRQTRRQVNSKFYVFCYRGVLIPLCRDIHSCKIHALISYHNNIILCLKKYEHIFICFYHKTTYTPAYPHNNNQKFCACLLFLSMRRRVMYKCIKIMNCKCITTTWNLSNQFYLH